MKTPDVINLTGVEMNLLKERLGAHNLKDVDYDTLLGLIDSFLWLGTAYKNKTVSLQRLLKMMFGPQSEKSKDILDDTSQASTNDGESDKHTKKKPAKGHGRRKASDHPNANHIPVPHKHLNAGDLCPDCRNGALYAQTPGTVPRFHAQPLISLDIWEPVKLRCGTCDKVFTAELPVEAGDKKYDESVGSMVGLLKYGMGMPFFRLGKLQKALGVFLPPSVQYKVVAAVAGVIAPAHNQLLLEAAQSNLFHNDDTPMKVMAFMKDGMVEEVDGRTGVYTTGVLAVKDERKIALFFTGRNHAGENLGKVLQHRAEDCDVPIQMCDALSRNVPDGCKVKLANCNVHSRRQFIPLVKMFSEECQYVIETYEEVYKNKAEIEKLKLSPEERLAYHKEHSLPLMDKMKEYLTSRIEEKKVEPNSSLGEAIKYMVNHWEKLTLFTREVGVPVDNNAAERLLKTAILNRKNAYFFKTERGAAVGDLFMSIIATCLLNEVNPFEYLTELQKHSAELSANPQEWMPWNFTATLARLKVCDTT